MYSRGPQNAHSASAAFFAQLNPHVLSPQETTLLNNLKSIAVCMQSVLPRGVSLQEWAQQRVPNEVAAAINASGLLYIPTNRAHAPRQSSPVAAIAIRPGPPVAGKGLVGKGSASSALGTNVKIASMAKTKMQNGSVGLPIDEKGLGKGQDAEPKPLGREAIEFFRSLPADGFTDQEEALRTSVLDFLNSEKWLAKQVPINAVRNNPEVAEAVKACLPKKVSLKDWMENRIGGEVDIEADPTGKQQALISPKMTNAARKDTWFSSLPDGRLNPDEEKMKRKLIQLIRSWTPVDAKGKDRGPITLSHVGTDGEMKALTLRIMKKFPLREWIERRLSESIEVDGPHGSGQYQLRLVAGFEQDLESKEKLATERKEAFLDSLPTDGFTPEEETLRSAILDFLTSWTEPAAATMNQLGADQATSQAKKELFSQQAKLVQGAGRKTCSLREWVERRIGGEVDILEDKFGNWRVGFIGQIDLSKIPDPALMKKPGKQNQQNASEQQPGRVTLPPPSPYAASPHQGQKRKAEQPGLGPGAQKIARLSPVGAKGSIAKGGATKGDVKGGMVNPPRWGQALALAPGKGK